MKKGAAPSILLVEPHLRIRAAMELHLKQCGYEAVSVANGTAALALAKQEPLDLALMECELPDRRHTSFEICQVLVQEELAKAVLMMNSKPTRQMVLQAFRAGAADFVVKPIPYELLSKKLEKALPGFKEAIKPIDFGTKPLSLGEKVDIIVKEVATIRALPHAVAKIIQVASTQESGAEEMVRAAESDPTIAAMMLKQAASAFYSRGEPVTQFKQAVVRLGFKACKELVIGLIRLQDLSEGGQELRVQQNRVLASLHRLRCFGKADLHTSR